MDFEGKRALVTGGGAGIGRALVLTLAREGADVLVVDSREEAAREVADEVRDRGNARGVVCDISDREALAALADDLRAGGGIDLLFANAGVGAAGSVADIPEHNWRWVLAVNLEGTLHTLQVLLPLITRPGGHVTITASMAGLTAPAASLGVYAASKAFLVSVGEALRAEQEPEGVGVHLLCPGLVDTRIWDGARARPQRFGGPVSLPESVGEIWKAGLDPDHVAQCALQGIHENELYVLVPQGEDANELRERQRALERRLGRASSIC